ncbi:MAG: alkaline phosphatase family protein [Candidatus Cybelea sp.]
MPKANLAALALAALLAGCQSGPFDYALRSAPRYAQDDTLGAPTNSPIKHVVIVIQENRTFNDFFATFPGADGTTTGKARPNSACGITGEQTIKLKERGLVTTLDGEPHDLAHSYRGYDTARNGGAMDGFDAVNFVAGTPECTYPYQYTDPADIQPYWDMAKQYALAEHLFTTQGSSSFTAHQDLIAGDTLIAPDEALVDLPSQSPWGCDAPHGTRTSLITKENVYKPSQGPFPCLTYPTLRDRLDAKGVSWRYYVPPKCCSANGKLLDAFDAIKAVRNGPQWSDGHITSQMHIFRDLTDRRLQAVSWVIPDQNDSDHPGTSSDTGPSWVASVVNAIGESSYWSSTAIVIVWDDWGGLYDNLAPPQLGYGGLGFRVPAIVVSPYAKPGHISRTQYEFGSILKYVEANWGLKSLERTDRRAASIADCLDYSQPPIAFKPIKAKYSRAYFLRRQPSNLPIDSDI